MDCHLYIWYVCWSFHCFQAPLGEQVRGCIAVLIYKKILFKHALDYMILEIMSQGNKPFTVLCINQVLPAFGISNLYGKWKIVLYSRVLRCWELELFDKRGFIDRIGLKIKGIFFFLQKFFKVNWSNSVLNWTHSFTFWKTS